MKFTCERTVLLNGLTIAARTAAVKSPIHALEGLLVETGADELSVTGYDLKTGIRTRVPADILEEGRLIMNAKLIVDIVRKLPDGILTVETDENLMTKLSCGRSRFEIMSESAEEYPDLPVLEEENSFKIQEKKLKSMIEQTLFAVATNEIRPVQTGEKFEVENGILTVAAVDGYRLAVRSEELEDSYKNDTYSFVVPSTTLSEASKIATDSEEPATIHIGARHILLSVGDTEIISRKLEGEFLDYRRHIAVSSKYCLTVSRRKLQESFERVSLIISEKYKAPIRCKFGEDCVELSSATGLGKSGDICQVEGTAENLEIGFNDRYMLDALRAAPDDNLKLYLNNGSSPCILKPVDDSGKFVYLILPVRLHTEGK